MFRRWSQGLAVSFVMVAWFVCEGGWWPSVEELYVIAVPGLIGLLVSSVRINYVNRSVVEQMVHYALFVYLVGLCFKLGAGYAFRMGCAPRHEWEYMGRFTASLVWPAALFLSNGLARLLGLRDETADLPND